MTLNVMKPAEGIYTTGEMPKVFTLRCEMTRVFTPKGEMPKVFTLHSVRVFTPKENKWGIYTAFNGVFTPKELNRGIYTTL